MNLQNICLRGERKSVWEGESPNTLASIKSKLADKDMLLEDRKRYEAQLHDQKDFMSPKDYVQKSCLRAAVIKTLNKQLALLDEQLAKLVTSDEKTSRQVELLKSVDRGGDRIALYMMVAVTMGFKRFQSSRQFFCYAGLAPFRYTSGKSIHSKSKVSQRTNKHIKALLHLAAVSVATHMKDCEYRGYYERKASLVGTQRGQGKARQQYVRNHQEKFRIPKKLRLCQPT